MGPGQLIALNVVLLYAFLGPIVLFGFYVLLDVLIKSSKRKTRKKKDPALMTSEDFRTFFDRV